LAHDLTGPSEIALVRAARLALERDGHLTIFHVVDSRLPAPVIEAQRAHARSSLESEVRRWLGQCKLSYRIDIGVGEPVSAITARAQADNVNLVVTARHYQRAFASIFAPAAGGRLLRQTPRPILVVSSSNQSPYRRVLIPIDCTNASAARIQFAAAFLPQARLHLLHAHKRCLQDYVAPLSLAISREQQNGKFRGLPRQEQPERALGRFIETLGLGQRRPLVTSEDGDAVALVKQELAREKVDLLVLGADASLERAPIGSGALAALGSSRCDLLFPPPLGRS
jgi:nucleotide-binding universal stress UspA family protein